MTPFADASSESGPGEGGRAGAVVEEAADADAGVVGVEHLREAVGLEVEPDGERAVEATVDHTLGDAHGDDGARRERGRPLERRVDDLGGGDDAVDEPD